MTRFEALVTLNLVADIGTIRLNKLLEFFGKPENILKAPAEKLIAAGGIGEKIAAKICSLKSSDLDRELTQAKKLNLEILTQDDNGYPGNLKNIPDPPLVLYVKGKLKEEDRLAVGIVGSRRASFYGLSCAQRFASDLAEKGFTIISGMARGIDTYAHRGALKARGRTIAVMGSGFNRIYPAENKKLAEEIARSGAVISEFPVDTEPLRQNFPCRNRVISGLSLGILVAEAARNSGALITADFALEQGREVFALPGEVNAQTSFGTNELIKQGAKLVTGVDDILEEFFMPLTGNRKADAPPAQEARGNFKSDSLNEEENRLYALISSRSLQIDELVEKTNLAIPKISDILFRLQLKGLIKELPGKQIIRN